MQYSPHGEKPKVKIGDVTPGSVISHLGLHFLVADSRMDKDGKVVYKSSMSGLWHSAKSMCYTLEYGELYIWPTSEEVQVIELAEENLS